MTTSTLEHDMAGSAGDQTDLHIRKLHIHIQTVNMAHTVNAFTTADNTCYNIILSEAGGCYGHSHSTLTTHPSLCEYVSQLSLVFSPLGSAQHKYITTCMSCN